MRDLAKSWIVFVALAAAGCASDSGGDSAGGAGKSEGPAKSGAPAEGEGKGGAAAAPEDPWAGSGFSVWDLDGRWWVFLAGSRELESFLKGGEPVKSVTRVGAGPGGVTLRSVDASILDAFAAWKPGFSIRLHDGRLWIFRAGSKELATYDKGGEPVKSVTRVGAGPARMTIRSTDAETLDAWAATK